MSVVHAHGVSEPCKGSCSWWHFFTSPCTKWVTYRASTLARGWMEFTWPKIDARHVCCFLFCVHCPRPQAVVCKVFATSLGMFTLVMDFLIIQRPSSWDFCFESIGPCCIGGWHSLNTRMQRGKIAWSISRSWHDRGGNQFAWLHMADNLVAMHIIVPGNYNVLCF